MELKGDLSMRLLKVMCMFIISFFIIGTSFKYYVDVNENTAFEITFQQNMKPEEKLPTLEELNFITPEEKSKRRQDFDETNKECYTIPPDKYKVPVLEEYREYKEKYEHFYGWLKIDGTKIDDPVMYTPWYRDYYLDKDVDGKYLKRGTLFIGDNSVFYPNCSNIIIYGHNMANQTRFGSLKKYNNKKYYDEHRIIHFDTYFEKADYIVIAAFYARILYRNEEGFRYYSFDFFENKEAFDYYMEKINGLRLYDTNVPVEYGDNLITLSTCSYHTENGRFVVVAKKLDEEEKNLYLKAENKEEEIINEKK